MGLARSWSFAVKLGETSQGVLGGIATPGLFQTFKIRPQLGRLFTDLDVPPGNEHVAIVSHRFRVASFGLDDTVIGQSIDIDGVKHEIVGALPEGFSVPDLERVELWIPLWPERLSFRS